MEMEMELLIEARSTAILPHHLIFPFCLAPPPHVFADFP
jgi:hypothetical protein